MSQYGINAWEIVGVVDDGEAFCAPCARKLGIDLSEDGDAQVIFAAGDDATEITCDECGEVLLDTI